MDASLVMFAIDAGIRLGRQVNAVLVDETAQRPLLLPLGDLFGSITEADAMRFFATEGSNLVAADGPLRPFRADSRKLVDFYRALKGVEEAHRPAATAAARRSELVTQLVALDQFDTAFKSGHPARRIFGTMVEISIDYLATHPDALGKDSPARSVVRAFIGALDETRFAEGPGREVLGDLLSAALRTLGDGVALAADATRLELLLGGVLDAVAADLDAALRDGNPLSRQQLFRRIGSSILRGGSAALSGNISLFVPGEGGARTLVQQTLMQVLQGMSGSEDLFTTDAIEVLFNSALRAAAENAGLVTDDRVLQELMTRVLGVVADPQWDRLFSSATAASVLIEALEVFRENAETLLDPQHPREQFLAGALEAMVAGLSTKLAGGGRVQDLLSRKQALELTRIVFGEVARNPQLLVGTAGADARKTVLAQVTGSVARALGTDPLQITNGAGFVELVRIALAVTVQNANLLIDTKSASPGTNLLCTLLKQVVSGVSGDRDPRRLVTRDVFLDLVRCVLAMASANLEVLVGSQPQAVHATVAAALSLASGKLKHRINGANLPLLVERLLRQVLWEELDPADAEAVEQAALRILRTA